MPKTSTVTPLLLLDRATQQPHPPIERLLHLNPRQRRLKSLRRHKLTWAIGSLV